MSNESILKSLSRETKALIVVSEFEARRMPMFQMRAVLNEIVANEEEKKLIIDLVENDLKATGYHPNQISAFLQDLLNDAQAAGDASLRTTRRLRSPFAQGFEVSVTPPPDQAAAATPAAPAAAASPGTRASPFAGLTSSPAPQARSAPPSPAGVPGLRPAGVPGLSPAPVPGLGPPPAQGAKVGTPTQGVRVSQTAPPGVAKPKVPVTTPTPIPGKSPTPLPQGTRAGIGKTGVPVDAAFFGSGVAAMHMESKPTILLADDDKRIRIVFRLCMERMGFRVLEAEDGNEAWKKIQAGGLALVCLDMKMPGLHGLEVLQRMTNSQIETPVIICSAYDQLKDEFIIATHPRLRYLVKPVASEALEKAIKELIGEPAKGA